jgi:hypothetical protein
VTRCTIDDWEVRQHLAYYRPGSTHISTSTQQYHHPRSHGQAGRIFMTVGKLCAHGCHACEIGCQGSTRLEISSAHNSCKKLCVGVGGHVRVSPVKCIAKYTLSRTNSCGLVALHTKKKRVYKPKEISICTYICETCNNFMLGMRENPDCPLPAHASCSLTSRLRRKG